jgi:hypothetical protein
MKVNFCRFLAAFLVPSYFVSSHAAADDAVPEQPPAHVQKFYITANFGYSGISYTSNPVIQNFAATQQNGNSSHFPLAIDLAGLLQVLDSGTAVGIGYDGIVDSYTTNGSGNSGSVNQSAFAGTIRHYFGDAVGHGAFLRGDIGIDVISLTTTQSGFLSLGTTTTTTSTFYGFFVLGGAGYSLGLSPHVNLSLEGDYGRVFVGSGAIGEWQPKAGILISF